MKNRNAIEPIGHVPVYRRIEIGQRRYEVPAIIEAVAPYVSATEQDRIWSITRQAAEGCGAPTISPSDYIAPDGDAA